jgi:4-hydroxyphenylpyruvate dioxygenase-like putative hemolysin
MESTGSLGQHKIPMANKMYTRTIGHATSLGLQVIHTNQTYYQREETHFDSHRATDCYLSTREASTS